MACAASVSVQFWSKERGTRIKDRAKNGASKRAGKWWGRKEGNFPSPSPLFHFLDLVPIFARTKRKIFLLVVPPKPHGNACYAGYHTNERVFLYFSL